MIRLKMSFVFMMKLSVKVKHHISQQQQCNAFLGLTSIWIAIRGIAGQTTDRLRLGRVS